MMDLVIKATGLRDKVEAQGTVIVGEKYAWGVEDSVVTMMGPGASMIAYVI